tara:strand:+ start:202 stop:399 length:198 start_codon:yes stop_codon:yes gene_type:complete
MPRLDRARARFTDIVDFPTPPLPEDIAIICFTLGNTRFVSDASLISWLLKMVLANSVNAINLEIF